MDRTLQNLRRKLEKAELEHLRQHCSELARRLEVCEERAQNAEEMAEHYWQEHMDLIQSLTDQDDIQLGMNKDGDIGIIKEAA